MSAGTNQVGILEFWLTCRLRGINTAHLRSIKSYHLGSSELDSSALSKGAVAIEFWVFYMLMQVWCGLTLNFSRKDGSLDTYKKVWQIYPFRTQWVRTKPICWPDLSHRPPAYKFWFKCKKKKMKPFKRCREHMTLFLPSRSRKDLSKHNQNQNA